LSAATAKASAVRSFQRSTHPQVDLHDDEAVAVQAGRARRGGVVRLPDFAELISSYGAEFRGRGWLLERLGGLLDEPDCRIAVLTGVAGVGKTAVLAHLAARHIDWLRYFIRRDSSVLIAPGDARTFLLTVGGQLAAARPALFAADKLELVVHQRAAAVTHDGAVLGAKIDELRASPFFKVSIQVQQEVERVEGKLTGVEIGLMIANDRQYSVTDLQFLALVDPLKVLAEVDPGARVVVLIDALDELRCTSNDPSADVLKALLTMPDMARLANLRFVVSSRPEAAIIDELLSQPGARHLKLDAESQDNRADLRNYAAAAVGELAQLGAFAVGTEMEAFAETLVEKANGNFLFARSVIAAIRQAASEPDRRDRMATLLDIDELPADLTALYRHFLRNIERWCRAEFPERTWRGYLAPLLGALAVAQEPLSKSQLVAFTGLSLLDLNALLRDLRQFVEELVGDPDRFRIFHVSLSEYLADETAARDYYLPPRESHRAIARAYGGAAPEWSRSALERIDDYGLAHLASHLRSAELPERLHALIRETWAGVHERRDGHLAAFLSDVGVARSVAEAAEDSGLMARYALFESSVHGLSRNLPARLVRSLLEQGLWSERQALEIARLASDDAQKADLLIMLAPTLGPDLFPQALALARSLPGGRFGRKPSARWCVRLQTRFARPLRVRRFRASIVSNTNVAASTDWCRWRSVCRRRASAGRWT
jgi:hypothetical protein